MKKLIISFLILTLLSSCNELLEKHSSRETVPAEEAFNRFEDVQLALLGAYTPLRNIPVQLMLFPDYITQNSDYIGPSTLDRDMVIIPFSASAGRIIGFWDANYRAVNQANLVLKVLTDRPDLGEASERDRARGEALFLKGVAYFELLRIYSRPYGPNADADLGIPIMDLPTTSNTELLFPARSSVQETYNEAIRNFEEAADLLSAPFLSGRAHRFAALAYLARIAFQQRDYEMAAQYAQQTMAGPFSLNETPREFFDNEGSREEIWVVTHTEQDGGQLAFRTRPGFAQLNEDLMVNGFGKILSQAQIQDLVDNELQYTDLRLSTLTRPNGNSTASIKYDDPLSADDTPMIRLPEMMLIRAESLVRLNGINAESLDLLNQIRRRAIRIFDEEGNEFPDGLSLIEYEASDFASVEGLIEAIILERRVEFFMEGNRFHDLMRLERPVQGFDFDADELRWPIPQAEIDANGNLVQNPGY